MLARAIFIIVLAVALLAGCVDSERLRHGLAGPSGGTEAERNADK